MPPQRYPHLITRACDIFHDKEESRLQIELRLLISWHRDGEITLDYPGESSVITRVLLSERVEEEGLRRGQSDTMIQLAIIGFEDGEGHFEPRNVDSFNKSLSWQPVRKQGPELLELNSVHNLNECGKGFVSSRKQYRPAYTLNL